VQKRLCRTRVFEQRLGEEYRHTSHHLICFTRYIKILLTRKHEAPQRSTATRTAPQRTPC
jgi:hypothetical protein